MKIVHGLLEGQVLQRDSKGKCYADLKGKCVSEGDVEIRILKNVKTVVHGWTVRGRAIKKEFSAKLTAVKTGGPYRAEFRIRKGQKVLDEGIVSEFFVGDVWILAGQSNMQGVGNLVEAPKPHEMVRAFYMRDEWGVAKEKMHFLEEAVDPVHNDYGSGPNRPSKKDLQRQLKESFNGVGPGLGFGLEMRRRTRVPQGLICCAHGGTSMDQWSPERLGEGGGSLYGAMMRRYVRLGQPVAGILWYQGESDANPEDAKKYTQRMKRLVASTREDMGQPKLPWSVVQLGRHTSFDHEVSWNSIQEQQRCLPQLISDLDVAPAIDLDMDDGIHISGKAQGKLGERLARITDRMVHGNRKSKKGISLKSIRLIPNPNGVSGLNDTLVEVTYDNVTGNLMSEGLPTGYALLNEKRKDSRAFFKTTLKGNRVFLHSNMNACELETMSLSYGHGKDPYCNITDKEGMSIPVMQRVPIVTEIAHYCNHWQSKPLTDLGKLSQFNYAKTNQLKGWKAAPPRAGIGVLPKERDSKKIGLFALRTHLKADDKMTARWFMWANAPFKVWLNGKAILDDSKASPPMNKLYDTALKLKKGENEIMVVMDLPKPAPFLGIVAQVGDDSRKRLENLSF